VQETSLEHVVMIGLDVTFHIELYLVTYCYSYLGSFLESRRLQNVVFPARVVVDRGQCL
jgi:hypothetical protein